MRIVFLNLLAQGSPAAYLLSSYVLKAFVRQELGDRVDPVVLNLPVATDTAAICDRILGLSPDAVGHSCYVWNIEKTLAVSEELGRRTPVAQIFGGPEISLERIATMGRPPGKVFYILGEGERPLVALLESGLLANGGKGGLPPGVAGWDGDRLDYPGDAERIPELDRIPSPYLEGAVEEACFARRQALVETQRGCRYRCRYCVYHKQRHRLAYYSLDRVLAELDWLILRDKPPIAIRFTDAVLTSDLGRAKKIVRHLLDLKKRNGGWLPLFYWEFNYEAVDGEFFELVSGLNERKGILNVAELVPMDRPQYYGEMSRGYGAHNAVGVQSLCDASLKSIGRPPVRRDELAAFMESARKHNVVLKVDFILGLPFETIDSFFGGLEYVLPFFRDTDHVFNLHRLQILPGSELEKAFHGFGIQYHRSAPHLVVGTGAISATEMERASKLCAMLFRVLNSPFRGPFFALKDRRGCPVIGMAEQLLEQFLATAEFARTRLAVESSVDDDYWNSPAYREIPSAWLRTVLDPRA